MSPSKRLLVVAGPNIQGDFGDARRQRADLLALSEDTAAGSAPLRPAPKTTPGAAALS